MIAVRPAEAALLPQAAAATRESRRHTPLVERLVAAGLALAVVGTLSGFGVVSRGSAFSLQGQANALHDRWALMRDEGVPEADLLGLEAQWTISRQNTLWGVAAVFWMPGGADTLRLWTAQTDAIWNRAVNRYRSDALVAEAALHRALPIEPAAQRSARLLALANASTPLDFSALRDQWEITAKLIPIDARIAGLANAVVAQRAQAKQLGIRDDPAATDLAAAAAYASLTSSVRIAHAEFLTRTLVGLEKDLKNRLDAATISAQAIQHAQDEANVAALYGLDTRGFQGSITTARANFGTALTVGDFAAVAALAKQAAAAADNAIYVALSQTHVISGIAFYYQDHPLSCEEASTSMALTHQGVYVSQDQILNEVGADLRPMYVDSAGRVRWGNAYETFVGNVNGSESNYTGLGTFYPPLVRVAKAHGARVLAYGSMSAATIYARVIAGHPVVAFATWDWRWHPRRDYLSFDGQWIPWIGPVYASHVYVVAGVSPSQVLVYDPIRGQYWISKAAFEAGYSDFAEAIVFA